MEASTPKGIDKEDHGEQTEVVRTCETPPVPGPKSGMWNEEGCACGQYPNHVRKQLLRKPKQRKNTPTVLGGNLSGNWGNEGWQPNPHGSWQRTFSRQHIKYGWAHGTWEHCTKRESYSKYCGRWLGLTIKWAYCVLVRQASGRRILASRHTIFYSGRTDTLHRGGVCCNCVFLHHCSMPLDTPNWLIAVFTYRVMLFRWFLHISSKNLWG